LAAVSLLRVVVVTSIIGRLASPRPDIITR